MHKIFSYYSKRWLFNFNSKSRQRRHKTDVILTRRILRCRHDGKSRQQTTKWNCNTNDTQLTNTSSTLIESEENTICMLSLISALNVKYVHIWLICRTNQDTLPRKYAENLARPVASSQRQFSNSTRWILMAKCGLVSLSWKSCM